MLRVVDTNIRSGRHLDRLRRLSLQFLRKRPRQEIFDYRRQIKLTEVAKPRDFAQVWREPVFERVEEIGIAEIRPLTFCLAILDI